MKSIYYCNECKKVVNNIGDVIFVEQMKYRCFCCEQCIVNFYTPLIKHFENEEKDFRTKNNIKESFNLSLNDREKKLELTLREPDEIWLSQNDLSEEIYFFLKNHNNPCPCTTICATLMFDGNPSFILLETSSEHNLVLDFFRRGRKIDIKQVKEISKKTEIPKTSHENSHGDISRNINHNDKESHEGELRPMDLDPQFVAFIESKKAYFLSKLLKERNENDFPFEEFPQYDVHLQESIENPDEIYEQHFDGEESELNYYVYIKSFQKDFLSFFYVVIAFHTQVEEDKLEETLIPIISFPSRDPELYKKFKRGTRVDGHSLS